MLQTYEAIINEEGNIRLTEPVQLAVGLRVLVTVLDELPQHISETALLSEAALAEDWDKPEEDEAWSHLQQAALS